MKKLILAAAILVSGLAFNNSAEAQVRVNVNIGSQPDWGPAGYDYVNYYYLPDIDTYYSVPTHEYIYFNNNRWVRSASLPARYRNYNVYNNYKVVVNDRNPWERADVYRSRYAGFRNRHDQVIIRNSRNVRYTDRGRTVVIKEKDNRGRGNDRWNRDWNRDWNRSRGR
jgi:hypothetical protein